MTPRERERALVEQRMAEDNIGRRQARYDLGLSMTGRPPINFRVAPVIEQAAANSQATDLGSFSQELQNAYTGANNTGMLTGTGFINPVSGGGRGGSGRKGPGAGADVRGQEAAKNAVIEYAEANDIPVVKQEGDTIQVLNTGFGPAMGASELKEAFGVESIGDLEFGNLGEPGDYATVKIEDPSFSDYANAIVPAAMLTAIGGAAFGPMLSSSLPGAATGVAGTSGATAATLGNTALTAGITAGVSNAATQGLTTGSIDPAEVLKTGVSGALTGGMLGKFVPGYSSQNVVGSFIQGTTNDLVNQAIMEGKIDIADAAKAGLIQGGIDTVSDLFGDALHTNDGNLIEGVDQLNGTPILPEDIERLSNTSDLYGLLGKEGLLSKIGLNPDEVGGIFTDDGYLKTGMIGDALDLVNLGGRPVTGEVKKARDAAIEGFNEGELTAAQALEQYYGDTQRYDERFFDLFTPRSEGSPLQGIWEKNPYASSDSVLTQIKNTFATGLDSVLKGDGGTTVVDVFNNAFEPTDPYIYNFSPEEIDEITDSYLAEAEKTEGGITDTEKEEVISQAEAVKDAITSEEELDLLANTIEDDTLAANEGGLVFGYDFGSGAEEDVVGNDPTTLPSSGGGLVFGYGDITQESGLPTTEAIVEDGSAAGEGEPGGEKISMSEVDKFMAGLNPEFWMLNRLNPQKSSYIAEAIARMKG